jgi:hypothetical protein
METEQLEKIYELEERFLEKLQKAYTEYDIEFIKDSLSDNVTYDSIWIIEQITNKTDYCNYLENKLNAMKTTGKLTNFMMMYEQGKGRPHLIFTPRNLGGYGCFTLETENGFIKAIHLTPSDFYHLGYKDKEKYEQFMQKANESDV